MKTKEKLKRLLSGVLAGAMSLSMLPGMSAFAEETVERYPYTMFAGSDTDGAITVNADNFCVNGSIATNGTITSSGNMNINGTKTKDANKSTIVIFDKIDSEFFASSNVNTLTDDYTLADANININTPTEVMGKTTLTGNININTAFKSFDDINFNGDVKNINNSVVFSKYGNIIIDSQNVNLNGLIYAPFGNVEITANNINLNNVVIIADTITLNSPNVNANYDSNIATFIGVDTENYVIPYDDYVYFLDSNNDIYGDFDNDASDEFIQFDNETSKYNNVEIEYYGENIENPITNINEIYGAPVDSLTNLQYKDIAKIAISSQLGVDSDTITISEPINLLDANNVITYLGFNYYTDDDTGYITIAKHSKEVLIRDMVDGENLPAEYGNLYYLSSGEFYYSNNGYYTLNGTYIEEDEFKDFLEERKNEYFNFTTNILADLESTLISQLNNLIYINNYGYEENNLQKTYNGQSGEDYGGIDDCSKYLADRYGGTITKSSSKSLSMANFKQSSLGSGSNCSLAAITRVLYYYNKNGYAKIDNDYTKIYKKVEKVAKKYGYSSSNGTSPTKINNIVDDVLKNYGYGESKCNGIYAWTFNGEVKEEIDSNKPVIMNIARGYYGDHTVTVCGYSIYKRTKKFLGIKTTKTYNMIQIYDGWSTSKKYIDFSAFAYDLISSGFGSFNTVTMKK